MKPGRNGVLVAGLALFSMFFGAGDLIWPLILGGQAGGQNFYAVLGLLISGVSLPLLGLVAMMLFQGDYRSFFGQTGKVPGAILIFIIQAILGPLGSIPRLMTLAHATLKPYMPLFINLPVFSILACILVFLFTVKRNKVIDIIGMVLGPVLLIAFSLIFLLGFIGHPEAPPVEANGSETFFSGLNVGYNTLDLIASFIFAPLVLSYFRKDDQIIEAPSERRQMFKKMLKACLIAGSLLALMFIGLTYLASYYTPILPQHAPEERLAMITQHLFGKSGAFLACLAVSLSCLTTAIPITLISSDYIRSQFMKNSERKYSPILISLGISAIFASFGFMGIAAILSPILQIVCPGLIILSIFNILHKLYEMRMRKVPIFAAFALSFIGYAATL